MDAAADQARLYTTAQIATASLIGGPLPACWFIAHNFGALNHPARRRRWLVGGLASMVVLLAVVVSGILQHSPEYVFPIAYSLGLREWARKIQGEAIAAHRAAGQPMGFMAGGHWLRHRKSCRVLWPFLRHIIFVPVASIMGKHLTKRSSQPLAVALSHFNVMKQLSILATLAPASGG